MEKNIGWKGLFRIYLRQKPHVELTHPLYIIIPLLFILFFYFKEASAILELLTKVSDSIFNIFPSLAGLSLAGYTIIVGGIQPRFLKRLAHHDDAEDASLLVNLNMTFAVAIIYAIVVLSLAFLINLLCNIGLKTNSIIAYVVNYIGLILLIYASLVCLRSLLAVVINVFNFGQALDKFVNQENVESKNPLTDQTHLKNLKSNRLTNKYNWLGWILILYNTLSTLWLKVGGKMKRHNS